MNTITTIVPLVQQAVAQAEAYHRAAVAAAAAQIDAGLLYLAGAALLMFAAGFIACLGLKKRPPQRHHLF